MITKIKVIVTYSCGTHRDIDINVGQNLKRCWVDQRGFGNHVLGDSTLALNIFKDSD